MKSKIAALLLFAGLFFAFDANELLAQSPLGMNRPIGYSATNTQDWVRFYHYPYVYYPQNFAPASAYRSADSLYYRYAPNMQVPMYNPYWQNYYPVPRRFHEGKHFVLDIF
ncbi:MAG: calmodulin-binding protein [Planctomycetia bacterium]|nr:calmodulin-binding protein [Planctomycetia bacterium]